MKAKHRVGKGSRNEHAVLFIYDYILKNQTKPKKKKTYGEAEIIVQGGTF
jgi:hypothetical protein